MPGFGVPSDAEALEKMRGLLPGREVVQIQSLDILAGGGNIHCITRHVPKAKERRHA
jgi:agmatine deiminase